MKAVARGFLKGAVLGAVVSVSGALGLSLLAGGPVLRGVTPETGEVNLPAGSEFNGARDDRQASLPDTDPAAAPSSTPPVAPPAPDDLTRLEGADFSLALMAIRARLLASFLIKGIGILEFLYSVNT